MVGQMGWSVPAPFHWHWNQGKGFYRWRGEGRAVLLEPQHQGKGTEMGTQDLGTRIAHLAGC